MALTNYQKISSKIIEFKSFEILFKSVNNIK